MHYLSRARTVIYQCAPGSFEGHSRLEAVLLKILLDEMYTGLKENFEIMGWEVVTVHEAELQGAKDREIVEYAAMHDLLLVTRDQKTAELAEYKGVKYVRISNMMIAKIGDAEIRERYPDIKPK